MKTIKGITWNHTRGYAPLAATSMAWRDFHPDVEIKWDIRSLWSFGEEGLERMTGEYDLLLVDHPFMGTVSQLGLFLPLEQYIPADELDLLRSQSVGQSFESYQYKGHLWALAVDAASQVSAFRADLLQQQNYSLPTGWAQVVELARETGRVRMPMAPMGLLGSFFTLYANQFESPFGADQSWQINDEKAYQVLSQLQELFALLPESSLRSYPTDLLRQMSTTDEILYIPITYGYVNYGIVGYAPKKVSFGPLPGKRVDGGTLGGVGIAISARTSLPEDCLAYARWIASADCQRTIYALSGGQPANQLAWEDARLNELTSNFYANTLGSTQKAFMRPRFDGFHHFQSTAARQLQDFLQAKGSPEVLIVGWKELYGNPFTRAAKNFHVNTST